MQRRVMLILTGVMFVLILIGPYPAFAQNDSERVDLEGVKVAVWYYSDYIVTSSAIALHAMFEWMNATVEYVNASEVRSDVLDEYDLLAMPGGMVNAYMGALGTSGIENLRDWIAEGGSYFGICGGAIFAAASRRLGIYNGTYEQVVPGDISMAQMEMTLNTTCHGPNLSDMPENFSTLYWGSSYFVPDEGFDYIPIARYSEGNGPGMIAFTYGYGNAFLSSPHPEYEEGISRDDTNDFDAYIDPDTEWDFLLRIAIWQIESSLPDSGDMQVLIYGLIIAGGIAVILVVVVFIKRRG
ncbi:MAG: BPL-N domain-containing protein [Candidatus Thorarchaeota archaeon]